MNLTLQYIKVETLISILTLWFTVILTAVSLFLNNYQNKYLICFYSFIAKIELFYKKEQKVALF